MTGNRSLLRTVSFIAILGLAACARGPSVGDVDIETLSAEEIYQTAERVMERGGNERAAEYFGEIERLFPYSDWASRGLVMQAYALHKERNYAGSRAAAQRYLDFYPTLEDADWAQYLVALSYYDQIFDIGRDQGLTVNALTELSKVIETYPTSEYADEARPRFDLAMDHLAAKEMEIGRYYLNRQEYVAAIKRFRVVVEDFQTTSHTAEALYRLVESYLSLGLTDEAQSAGAVLGHNFQSTRWYENAYTLLTKQGLQPNAKGQNWLSQIYRQVLQGQWL